MKAFFGILILLSVVQLHAEAFSVFLDQVRAEYPNLSLAAFKAKEMNKRGVSNDEIWKTLPEIEAVETKRLETYPDLKAALAKYDDDCGLDLTLVESGMYADLLNEKFDFYSKIAYSKTPKDRIRACLALAQKVSEAEQKFDLNDPRTEARRKTIRDLFIALNKWESNRKDSAFRYVYKAVDSVEKGYQGGTIVLGGAKQVILNSLSSSTSR